MAAEKTLGFSISINGISNEANELAKLEFQLKNLKKEKTELLKVSQQEGILSNENKQKLAAYNREIGVQEASLKTLKRVVDSAADSLARKKALLIELTAKSDKATQAIRDGMAPAIKKLNDEIKAGENARGVFTRNVGNYPELTKTAAGGFNQLTSAVGGTTGEIGNAITSFATAGGAAGIFTAVIGTLAAAWKRTQENIELYLTSADKLKFGFAGYEKDAEKARLDARRRASGQVSTGQSSLTEANRIIDFAGSTAEQREQAKLMAEQAKSMIAEGVAFRDQVVGIKDKITWTLKYNKLLQEDEAINDEKLAKEIEWEGLESDLVKQRVIQNDTTSTLLDKDKARVEAKRIANKLETDKLEFLKKEIKNVEDLSKMTLTQEVVEDKLNGLLKERETITKEYSQDQLKINRFIKGSAADEEKAAQDKANLITEIELTAAKVSGIRAVILAEQEQMRQENRQKIMNTVMSGPHYGLTGVLAVKIKKETQETVDGIGNIMDKANANIEKDQEEHNRKELDVARKHEEANVKIIEAGARAKLNILSGAGNLLNALNTKNKTIQKTELIAEKGLAIAEVVIQTQKANAIIRANAWASTLPGPGYFLRAIANEVKAIPLTVANNFAAGLNIAAIIAATVTGLAGFTRGGKINRGMPINTGTADDTLIAVNKTETVLTQRHVAMLGGSGAMHNIGVPGYASGGYVGQQATAIPPSGNIELIDAMNARFDRLQVIFDINKLNSAQNELSIITTTNKI